MSVDGDRDRLSQTKMLESLQRDPQMTDMLTVYLSDTKDLHSYFIYCALIPSDQIEQSLSSPTWDLLHDEGMPGTVEYNEGRDKRIEYLRYGRDDGIEPLLIDRNFSGIRNSYMEICEEFRLFHGLYHDRKQDKHIKIDDNGSEHLIAVINPNGVKIRLKEIRQFLAIKDMHLSIQFDYRERSEYSLEELGSKQGDDDPREDLMCCRRSYGTSGGIGSHLAFSRLHGKRLVTPLPKSKSGFWGFAEVPKKKYVEFIIGIDNDGEEITYTSDPVAPANHFGANPKPDYLTSVHFSKQVLDKYYQQPSKYSIEESVLFCGYKWSLYIDNHHEDKVCAWLGDLGNLSYEEQLHWRTHNIPPEGGISEIYYKSQIQAQFTDPVRPEHLFKQRYHDLRKACDECLGWQLLLPLGADDEHHLQCMRIPASDEQREFDELVLSLTKILIDSLNEKSLNKLIPTEQLDGLKGGIARLETALSACCVEDIVKYISFLRRLQSLRSSSAAHRKGRNYQKIADVFGVESQSLRSVFSEILRQALAVLDFFITVVRSGRIKGS
jgi:hypothetical protein